MTNAANEVAAMKALLCTDPPSANRDDDGEPPPIVRRGRVDTVPSLGARNGEALRQVMREDAETEDLQCPA